MIDNRYIKELNKFAFPLLFQMVTSYFIGATDVAIIGRISLEAFNGSSLVSSTLQMIAGVIGVITITLNIKLGESLGAKDDGRFSREFFSSVFLSLIIGGILLIVFSAFGTTGLSIIYGLRGETLAQAIIYLRPMTVYVLFQLILFAMATYFKVVNKTKIILYASVLSSILDVSLDYVFVLGKFGLPSLGIGFAGFSTVFTMGINIVIYMVFIGENVRFNKDEIKYYITNSWNHLKDSVYLFLQDILDGSVYVILVNMVVIRLGNIEFASFTIINAILGLLFLFKYIYGSSTLSLVSVEKGKGDYEGIEKYPKYSVIMAMALYMVFSVIILLAGNRIPSIFSNKQEAIEMVGVFLMWFVFAGSVSTVSYIYKSSLQALGLSKFVLYVSAILNIVAVISMIIMTNYFSLSLYGIATSIFISETLLSIILVSKYLKEKSLN